jgi:hypothetical protein
MPETQKVRMETAGVADYGGFTQRNFFRNDSGVVALPVAGRTAAHRRIRLHGGMGTRIVKWRADRTGRPPVIPAAADTDADVLLSHQVIPHLPRPQSGGDAYDWSVEGEYVYVQKAPRTAGVDSFPVGDHPYPVQPVFQVASTLAAPYLGYYTAAADGQKFDALITKLASVVPTDANGQWQWPFLALPAVLSSTHLIGG